MSDNIATDTELKIIDNLPEPESTSFQTIHFTQIKRNPTSKSIPHEMNRKILNARESYIQSHGTIDNQSNFSLEAQALDMLDSISLDEPNDQQVNAHEVKELQNKNEEIRKLDIIRLKEMLEVIKLLGENKMELKYALISLGDLSGGSKKIHYNDKDGNCIRNKYGYFKRHDNSSINDNGINFEILYQVKLVLDSTSDRDQVASCLVYIENESKGLQDDLFQVGKSLVSILALEEGGLTTDPEPSRCPMEHIIELVNRFYYPIILGRIKSEISHTDSVDFNLKEDRYYLARKLTIIGELSREFLDNNSSVENKDCKKLFKSLKNLRNKLIHYHSRISKGISDSEQSKDVNERIVGILVGLKGCIDKGALKEDFDYVKLNKEIEEWEKVIFSSDSKKTSKENEKQHEKPLNPNSVEMKTKTIKKENNKNRANAIKMIIKAYNMLLNNRDNAKDIETLDKSYQGQLILLGNDSSSSYPARLDASHLDSIEGFVKDLQTSKNSPSKVTENVEKDLNKDRELNTKLSETMKQLIIESDFLVTSEKLGNLSRAKRPFVIEHIISIIGQIMRDIADLNSDLKVLQTSSIIDEASKSATQARNQGLAHNVFAFDKNWLEDQIKNNILPANEHFQAILTIFKINDCEVSRMSLISIALSFLNLGFFDSAIDYFRRTLNFISEHPEDKNKRCDLFELWFQLTIDSDFEELLGMDMFSFLCRLFLTRTYVQACKYDEMYAELEILKARMQVTRIVQLKKESLLYFVYYLYNSLVHCLLIKGMNRTCISLLNEIIPITNFPLFEVHLAWAYHNENKYLEAYQIIKKHYPFNFEPMERYMVFFRYSRILAYQPNKKESIAESYKCIDEMENIFRENSRIFKEKYSDEFIMMKSHLVRLRVQLLVEECCLVEETEENYNKLLVNLEIFVEKFHSIIQFIKHDLREDVRIASMDFWFCRAYSSLITNKVKDVSKEKRKLENAQMFYDRARIRLNSYRKSGRISVSGVKEMIKTTDYLANGYIKFSTRSDLDKAQKDIYSNKAIPYLSMVKQYMDYYNKLPKH